VIKGLQKKWGKEKKFTREVEDKQTHANFKVKIGSKDTNAKQSKG